MIIVIAPICHKHISIVYILGKKGQKENDIVPFYFLLLFKRKFEQLVYLPKLTNIIFLIIKKNILIGIFMHQ